MRSDPLGTDSSSLCQCNLPPAGMDFPSLSLCFSSGSPLVTFFLKGNKTGGLFFCRGVSTHTVLGDSTRWSAPFPFLGGNPFQDLFSAGGSVPECFGLSSAVFLQCSVFFFPSKSFCEKSGRYCVLSRICLSPLRHGCLLPLICRLTSAFFCRTANACWSFQARPFFSLGGWASPRHGRLFQESCRASLRPPG